MKTLLSITCLAITAFTITGCGMTPRRIAAERDKNLIADANYCRAQGFKEDTDAFSNCKFQLDQIRMRECANFNMPVNRTPQECAAVVNGVK